MEEREIKSPLKDEDGIKYLKTETKETPTTAKGKTNSVEKKKGTSGFNLGGIFKKKIKNEFNILNIIVAFILSKSLFNYD